VVVSAEQHGLRTLSTRSLWFLVLSGCAAGVSWFALFPGLAARPGRRGSRRSTS
jgi:uncharacterized membrane protein